MGYDLSDIEKVLQRKSWWAICFILPIARRLSLFIVNNTSIKPTTITVGSFLFVLLAAYCYAQGTYGYCLLGALFFEINYLFDCVDGTVARVKKMSSPLGAYLDYSLDRVRVVLLACCLAYGHFKINQDASVIILVMLYLGLNNLIILSRTYQEKVLSGNDFGGCFGVDLVSGAERKGVLGWWFSKTQDRNIMPYYHDIELDALVFVVAPLLGLVMPGTMLAVGLGVVLLLVLNILFIRGIASGAVSN